MERIQLEVEIRLEDKKDRGSDGGEAMSGQIGGKGCIYT